MTKEQAYSILGMAQEDLLDNHVIQGLLTEHNKKDAKLNTVIKNDKRGGKVVRIQNFQALIDEKYSHHSD